MMYFYCHCFFCFFSFVFSQTVYLASFATFFTLSLILEWWTRYLEVFHVGSVLGKQKALLVHSGTHYDLRSWMSARWLLYLWGWQSLTSPHALESCFCPVSAKYSLKEWWQVYVFLFLSWPLMLFLAAIKGLRKLPPLLYHLILLLLSLRAHLLWGLWPPSALVPSTLFCAPVWYSQNLGTLYCTITDVSRFHPSRGFPFCISNVLLF